MRHTKPFPFPDPAEAHALLDEADIGSGEKTEAQLETEAIIREIPPLPPSDQEGQDNQDSLDRDEDNPDADTDDGGQARERREHQASLERDEPGADLDRLDPVPPEGS